MSLTLSAKRLAHIALENQTNAEFVRIDRTDGNSYGMTSHVEDITLGSVTYASAAGYTPTAHSHTSQYEAGSVDVEAILDIVGNISRNDVEAGLFDNADIYIFITDYTDPVVDEHPIYRGKWGRVTLKEGRFSTEFYSLDELATQTIGRTHTASCDAELGDSRCNVPLTPPTWAATTAYTVRDTDDANNGSIVQPTSENGRYFICTVAGTSDASEPSWDTTIGNTTVDGTVTWQAIQAYTLTGTVTGVTDKLNFQDVGRTEAADYWAFGKVTFTSGLNDGIEREVKSFSATNIEMFLPVPFDIAVTDTYTIVTGCRKRYTEDCTTKFSNRENFRGFPYIPTKDVAGKFGGQ